MQDAHVIMETIGPPINRTVPILLSQLLRSIINSQPINTEKAIPKTKIV